MPVFCPFSASDFGRRNYDLSIISKLCRNVHGGLDRKGNPGARAECFLPYPALFCSGNNSGRKPYLLPDTLNNRGIIKETVIQ